MARDARVEAAIAHWAPRFVSNGVLLADFQEVTAELERWDDWCRAWSARAAVHEVLGRDALARGHRLTAGEHLTRAGVYYHFAKFLFVHDMDQMRAAHGKAIECRQLALPHLVPPGERVEIPYHGSRLPGILRRPTGSTRPPIVIMVPGLDSAKEEMESYELPFLARGVATLAIDGPGQGEAEYALAIRGDYEVAVTAVVDWLAGRSDVDPARIAVWGVSLGGYYAPRAAAFEPRLRREAFRVRSHCRTEDDARQFASTLSLKGVAHRIACPLFAVAGRRDRVIPWQDAERLAREVSGPVELLIIDDGNHVANNRPYRYRPQTADWLAEQLGVARQP
ncbi:MAG: alpha/beta hydrolase [Deltaproteobacteria bacterium]|nr:MAG: alpha/beta hydrolase [Deltaproteobacteria bacterium]